MSAEPRTCHDCPRPVDAGRLWCDNHGYLCAYCGLENWRRLARPEAPGLCPHHVSQSEEWYVGNRIACDFYHRGIVTAEVA